MGFPKSATKNTGNKITGNNITGNSDLFDFFVISVVVFFVKKRNSLFLIFFPFSLFFS
jgi:hypothetical protein